MFSTQDLCHVYHLAGIRRGDECKNTFNTPLGHFEYLVIPFGLTIGPAFFQGMVYDVLWNFLNHLAFVYLDDSLIFSQNQENM